MYNKKQNNNYIKFIRPDFTISDDRGALLQLVSRGWNQVNFINSNKDTTRGNHFHARNREAFFIISGKFDLILSGDQGFLQSFDMLPQDFFIIEPFIRHQFNFKENTNLISFYDKGVINEDGTMDIY
ncbi:Cupin domain-containing protein [Candidatus Hepatincolaceae symbiont of Richtersius coronifer]